MAARVYGAAFYNVVKETGKDREILFEVDFLLKHVVGIRKLSTFLEGSHIRAEDKHELVDRILGKGFSSTVVNLLHLLIDVNRVEFLSEILGEFRLIYDRSKGFFKGHIQSAASLTDAEKKRVHGSLERFTGKSLNLDFVVRPELIGGVLFSLGDMLIDFTLKGELVRLRARLKAIPVLENL